MAALQTGQRKTEGGNQQQIELSKAAAFWFSYSSPPPIRGHVDADEAERTEEQTDDDDERWQRGENKKNECEFFCLIN